MWRETSSAAPRPTPRRKNATEATLQTLRLRVRCLWQTHLVHLLDLHTGRCHYCNRRWTELYPPLGDA